MMRELPVSAVRDAVRQLFLDANRRIGPDIEAAVRRGIRCIIMVVRPGTLRTQRPSRRSPHRRRGLLSLTLSLIFCPAIIKFLFISYYKIPLCGTIISYNATA